MGSVIEGEPPEDGEGLVVWPAPVIPAYQVTTIEEYWRDKAAQSPFPAMERENLDAFITSAIVQILGRSPVYVVQG
jgi:hypothetical protein